MSFIRFVLVKIYHKKTLKILAFVATVNLLLNILTQRTLDEKDDPLRKNLPLEVLYKDVSPIVDGPNIFMIHTSDEPSIDPRILCSLESFGKMNPSNEIWFIVRSKYIDMKTRKFLDHLISAYSMKLMIVRLDPYEILKGTPLLGLLDIEGFWTAKNLFYNLSDLCRLAIVFRSGGFYSDPDMIIYNTISDLNNFIVRKTSSFVNNGVFHFKSGHPFLLGVMKYISKNFNKDAFGSSGPLAVTRSLKTYCRKTPLTNEDAIRYFNYKRAGICDLQEGDFVPPKIDFKCTNVAILHEIAMYPINTSRFPLLFNETAEEVCLKQLIQSSFGVHTSNRISAGTKASEGSAIKYLASSYCPLMYEETSGTVY